MATFCKRLERHGHGLHGRCAASHDTQQKELLQNDPDDPRPVEPVQQSPPTTACQLSSMGPMLRQEECPSSQSQRVKLWSPRYISSNTDLVQDRSSDRITENGSIESSPRKELRKILFLLSSTLLEAHPKATQAVHAAHPRPGSWQGFRRGC